MKLVPIDKRALIHNVKGTPKKILMKGNEEPMLIEHVRLGENITLTFYKQQPQETNTGNGRLGGDAKNSSPLPEGKMFSIGDTIEFTHGCPIYPKITQITSVIPQYGINGEIHHLEIVLL